MPTMLKSNLRIGKRKHRPALRLFLPDSERGIVRIAQGLPLALGSPRCGESGYFFSQFAGQIIYWAIRSCLYSPGGRCSPDSLVEWME